MLCVNKVAIIRHWPLIKTGLSSFIVMLLQSVGYIIDIFHSCVAPIGYHFAGPTHCQIITLVHSVSAAQSCLMLPVIAVLMRSAILTTCLITIATPLRWLLSSAPYLIKWCLFLDRWAEWLLAGRNGSTVIIDIYFMDRRTLLTAIGGCLLRRSCPSMMD